MKARPLHDRVLLKRIEEKEQAKGGIIIPDTAKEKPTEGEVISVGPGKMTEEGWDHHRDRARAGDFPRRGEERGGGRREPDGPSGSSRQWKRRLRSSRN